MVVIRDLMCQLKSVSVSLQGKQVDIACAHCPSPLQRAGSAVGGLGLVDAAPQPQDPGTCALGVFAGLVTDGLLAHEVQSVGPH